MGEEETNLPHERISNNLCQYCVLMEEEYNSLLAWVAYVFSKKYSMEGRKTK